MIPRCCAVGFPGSRAYRAKVPITSREVEKIGVDQHARNPCGSATALYWAQSESLAMSETITASLRCAAVPQEPAQGPIRPSSIACVYSLGRLGAAPCRKLLPSGLTKRIETKTLPDSFSPYRHI